MFFCVSKMGESDLVMLVDLEIGLVSPMALNFFAGSFGKCRCKGNYFIDGVCGWVHWYLVPFISRC